MLQVVCTRQVSNTEGLRHYVVGALYVVSEPEYYRLNAEFPGAFMQVASPFGPVRRDKMLHCIEVKS